jgi:hypothetical protein
MPDDNVAGAPATRPMLYVMVGLPGAGKTTRAGQIEGDRPALRLTPDEWMIPLFGDSEADGKRNVLEGRFVWLASRALAMGVSVVLDFGVWGKDERSALRWQGINEGRGIGHGSNVLLNLGRSRAPHPTAAVTGSSTRVSARGIWAVGHAGELC